MRGKAMASKWTMMASARVAPLPAVQDQAQELAVDWMAVRLPPRPLNFFEDWPAFGCQAREDERAQTSEGCVHLMDEH